jgi:NADPH:quinone reductase-like Zn-dependent oxidoreductase
MKAVVCRRYGPPEALEVTEIDWPMPGDDEVLVRVHATSVTSGDVRLRGFRVGGIFWLPARLMFGILRPRNPVPGMEFAGRIEAVGKSVKTLRVGDPVFGMKASGANAEYLTIPESGAVAKRPRTMSDAEAAAIPFGALSALVFLRDFARLRPGERVLIVGASGGVGVFAVQLAKHFGAKVTGVCSKANLGLVKSLGADRVIDYTSTDYTIGGRVYDVVLDTVGVTSFSRCKRILAPNGRHLFLYFGLREIVQMLWSSLSGGMRVVCCVADATKADLVLIKGLAETGVLRPVIDRTYSLHDVVNAHRYVDTARKRGSVIMMADALSRSLVGASKHVKTAAEGGSEKALA